MKDDVVGHEAADGAGNCFAGLAVEDAHVRAAARSGRRDDVRHAVEVHIGRGHAHAAGKGRIEGHEAIAFFVRDRIDDTNVRSAAKACARDEELVVFRDDRASALAIVDHGVIRRTNLQAKRFFLFLAHVPLDGDSHVFERLARPETRQLPAPIESPRPPTRSPRQSCS